MSEILITSTKDPFDQVWLELTKKFKKRCQEHESLWTDDRRRTHSDDNSSHE